MLSVMSAIRRVCDRPVDNLSKRSQVNHHQGQTCRADAVWSIAVMPTTRVRPREHETESEARRLVMLSLPKTWEHREVTGRDYGVDAEVEVFDRGRATGCLLLLQIKGTRRPIHAGRSIAVDVPIQVMRYAERFVVPFMLCVCSVAKHSHGFRFFWLQEYARIVLDAEQPKWRTRRRTIRVVIPADNIMPGTERLWRHIADHPRRLADSARLAHIQHEFRLSSRRLSETSGSNSEALAACRQLLKRAEGLRAIFGREDWPWSSFMRQHIFPRANAAIRALSRPKAVGAKNRWSHCSDLESSAEMLSAALATLHDEGLQRSMWKFDGSHDF